VAKKTEQPTEEKRELAVPIRWVIPDDLDVLWASNFVVQHSSREFILSFFQAPPPLLIDPTEEELKAALKDGYPAKAVARISLSPAAVKELIGILQTNLDHFMSVVEKELSEE
jgi:hypothetical protein